MFPIKFFVPGRLNCETDAFKSAIFEELNARNSEYWFLRYAFVIFVSIFIIIRQVIRNSCNEIGGYPYVDPNFFFQSYNWLSFA